jgi:putative nucleotidyltransferase with HDIG domain
MPRLADIERIWSHSIATAIIAERLAAKERLPAAIAYTGGLVHDIGRLGLLISERNGYADILQTEVETVVESLAFERERFLGVTHQEVGALLAGRWGIPPSLLKLIAHHHDAAAEDDPMLRVVTMACNAAGRIGYSEVATRKSPDAPENELLLPGYDFSAREMHDRVKGAVEGVFASIVPTPVAAHPRDDRGQ